MAADLLHARGHHARVHRSHDRVGVNLRRLVQRGLDNLGLGLGVERDDLDAMAENAARGVDFLEGELHAIVEIVAGDRAVAGELDRVHDQGRKRLLRRSRAGTGQDQSEEQQASEHSHGASLP